MLLVYGHVGQGWYDDVSTSYDIVLWYYGCNVPGEGGGAVLTGRAEWCI